MDPPKLGKISVIPASALEQTQLIGNGSCGQVYKVMLCSVYLDDYYVVLSGSLAHRHRQS